MGIPKKGSRTLVIDGKAFRYIVRRTNTVESKGEEEILVTVQEDTKSPGNVLQTRLDPCEVVSPQLVGCIVQDGVKNGWNPSKRGAAFVLKQA